MSANFSSYYPSFLSLLSFLALVLCSGGVALGVSGALLGFAAPPEPCEG